MNPTVDILSLTYNHEAYLPDFFNSVIAQTYRPLRLILVNDASPDNSEVVIQYYLPKLKEADIKFVYLKHKVNIGFFAAFDSGRNYIEGKYLATLETDDYYKPTKIEESVAFMEADPSLMAMSSEIDSLWEDGRYESNSWKAMGINQLGTVTPYQYLSTDNRCYTCTVVMRSIAFLQSPKDAEWEKRGYKMGDYPRLLWLAKRFSIGYLDRNLSVYRIHSDSASHRSDTYLEFVTSYCQIKEDAAKGLI